MNGATVSLLIALGLIVIGLLVLLIPLAANNWNFAALDPHKYETNTHTVTEDFAAISIDTSISDLTVLPSEDGTCRVQVEDNGVGIDAAALPFIFNRFYRADTSGKIKGTGLGLAIVKHAVEAHGGSITAESTPGTRTCFTITLPPAS